MFKAIGGAIIGGLLSGCLVWYGQTGSFSFAPTTMTYPELAAVILTGVAVLVTVLGVFIAVLTVWGYSQFKSIAQNAAKDHISDQLKNGEIRTHIEKNVQGFLEAEFKSGNLRKLIEERVDYVIYSGAAERAETERKEENSEPAAEEDDDE